LITPYATCFLKYNIAAFAGRTVKSAINSDIIPDVFWYGNSSPSFNEMRSNPTWNTNLSLEKNFRIRERYSMSVYGQATNLFNHKQLKPGLNNGFYSTLVPYNISSNHILNKIQYLRHTI